MNDKENWVADGILVGLWLVGESSRILLVYAGAEPVTSCEDKICCFLSYLMAPNILPPFLLCFSPLFSYPFLFGMQSLREAIHSLTHPASATGPSCVGSREKWFLLTTARRLNCPKVILARRVPLIDEDDRGLWVGWWVGGGTFLGPSKPWETWHSHHQALTQ